MKGNALMVAVIMVGIMVALFIGYGLRLNLFGGGEGALTKASLQTDIYALEHALDAAKLYMETSLDYSVYQACYDTLAREDIDSSEGFLEELESTTETYLNRYSKGGYLFLDEYSVNLPNSAIGITPGEPDSKFRVDVTPNDMLTTSSLTKSGEYITLEASAGMSREYDMPCYSLFLRGKELNPSIREAFDGAFNRAFSGLEGLETGCDSIGSCTAEFTGAFREALESALEDSVPAERGGYSVSSELLDASVTVTRVDRSGDTIQRAYKAEATQRVTIQEGEPGYYPVWNGTDISFEPMSLVFVNRASDEAAP